MERPDMWMIVHGTPSKFQDYFGPFKSEEYAESVARENFEDGEPWFVVPLSQSLGNEADDGKPGSVLDYFRATLGEPSADNAEEFQAMPLASNCGDECRQAIDTAAAFRAKVINAFGLETDRWYPEKARAVRELAEETCRCFITG